VRLSHLCLPRLCLWSSARDPPDTGLWGFFGAYKSHCYRCAVSAFGLVACCGPGPDNHCNCYAVGPLVVRFDGLLPLWSGTAQRVARTRRPWVTLKICSPRSLGSGGTLALPRADQSCGRESVTVSRWIGGLLPLRSGTAQRVACTRRPWVSPTTVVSSVVCSRCGAARPRG
jgi:hypothetical protein